MGHGVSIQVAFLAEAGTDIGTGHFIETLALATACQTKGMDSLVVVNADSPRKLWDLISEEKWTVSTFSPDVLRGIGTDLVKKGACLAITNFRNVTNDQVIPLAEAGLKVVCVDEWGKKHLDCNTVVNPSLVSSRYEYTSHHPTFQLYTGPQYIVLQPEYIKWHGKRRQFVNGIGSVVIAMGGIDRTGATLAIAEALMSSEIDADVHVVVGAGFSWNERLDSLVKGKGGVRWQVHRDMSSLASLFAMSDVGFTAGGNTLYELACVGTPAVVLHEDEHEREQGLAFEAAGFGISLGAGVAVVPQELSRVLGRLSDPVLRQTQSDVGKRLVDGSGIRRICTILAKLTSDDTPQFAGRGFELHQ